MARSEMLAAVTVPPSPPRGGGEPSGVKAAPALVVAYRVLVVEPRPAPPTHSTAARRLSTGVTEARPKSPAHGAGCDAQVIPSVVTHSVDGALGVELRLPSTARYPVRPWRARAAGPATPLGNCTEGTWVNWSDPMGACQS